MVKVLITRQKTSKVIYKEGKTKVSKRFYDMESMEEFLADKESIRYYIVTNNKEKEYPDYHAIQTVLKNDSMRGYYDRREALLNADLKLAQREIAYRKRQEAKWSLPPREGYGSHLLTYED